MLLEQFYLLIWLFLSGDPRWRWVDSESELGKGLHSGY